MSNRGKKLAFFCDLCEHIHWNKDLNKKPTGVFAQQKEICRDKHRHKWFRIYLEEDKEYLKR